MKQKTKEPTPLLLRAKAWDDPAHQKMNDLINNQYHSIYYAVNEHTSLSSDNARAIAGKWVALILPRYNKIYKESFGTVASEVTVDSQINDYYNKNVYSFFKHQVETFDAGNTLLSFKQ